jgi:hypothetical protein
MHIGRHLGDGTFLSMLSLRSRKKDGEHIPGCAQLKVMEHMLKV